MVTNIYRTQKSRCFPSAEAEGVQHVHSWSIFSPGVVVTKQRFVLSQHHFILSFLSDSGCSSLSREVFYHMMASSEKVFC